MGSSQSHSSRTDPPNDQPVQSSSSLPTAGPSSALPRALSNGPSSASTSTSRLSSLRRLSTMGSIGRRISDQNGKRGRTGSNDSSPHAGARNEHTDRDGERPERSLSKKQKRSSRSRSISPLPPPAYSTPISAPDPTSFMASSSLQEATPATATDTTTYPQPVAGPSSIPPSPILSVPLPTSPPISPPLLSPTSDPLAEERLQSLSTIREALGPHWPTDPSAQSPAVERLLHRFRRSSSFPPTPASPQPPSPSLPQRSMSDRITALLGFSNAAESPSSNPLASSPPSAPIASTINPSAEPTIDQLRQRLEQAREDLAETTRQLEHARERVDAARRRPTGAVLVIQGLAQTHVREQAGPGAGMATTSSDPNSGESTPSSPRRTRRASESHAQAQSGPDVQSSESHNGSSLEAQARMISGLLTVAAAATATTLLTPDQPTPTPSRSPAANALESIMNRLRPQRRADSVEQALSNYLRSALRDSRPSNGNRNDTAVDSGSANDTGTDHIAHVSDDFQRFLVGLQGDLVGAVRDFAAPAEVEGQREAEAASGDAESFVTATEGTATPTGTVTATPADGTDNSEMEGSSTAVPTFHHQPGQTLPGNRSQEVTGGRDGVPRRLNFFRAHLFPPVSPSTSTSVETPAPEDDLEALVPCIFIGVRSIRHDPAMTTADLVTHPSFPFVDGQVPERETTPAPASFVDNDMGANSSSTSARPPTPLPATSSPPGRRSLRDRVMERLTHSQPRRPQPPQGPLNTYLVYVIGGNYPRSHPVLAIPNLITGGPLTDEEMALVGELMGPAKPPTVGKEEIEKSGLKIVKGDEMKDLNERKELLDSCVDRCLICLGDYEPEEECRILNCRHGYHKECVDQWLSTGRNSCPACRSEAVDTKALASANEATAPVEPVASGTTATASGEAAEVGGTTEAEQGTTDELTTGLQLDVDGVE